MEDEVKRYERYRDTINRANKKYQDKFQQVKFYCEPDLYKRSRIIVRLRERAYRHSSRGLRGQRWRAIPFPKIPQSEKGDTCLNLVG